jgi:hypothetical protein
MILAIRDHSEDLSVDGGIILKWIIGEYGWRVWTGIIWLGIGADSGLL